MNLSETVSFLFESRVRSRGRLYFKNGDIGLRDVRKTHLNAKAYGTDAYDVFINNPEYNHLSVYCSCPYYSGGSGLCKHIWGTILAAELLNWSPSISGAKQEMRISYLDKSDYELFAHHDSDGDSFDEGYADLSAINPGTTTVASPRRPSSSDPEVTGANEEILQGGHVGRPRNWQTVFAGVNQDLNNHGLNVEPKERRLTYLIDVDQSLENGGIYVNVLVSERPKDGSWGKQRKQRIDSDFVSSLNNETDREAIAMALGTQTDFASRQGQYRPRQQSPSGFVLTTGLQEKILKLLCNSGRVNIRAREAGAGLMTVSWDDGEPWEFRLGIAQKNEAYELAGFFKRGEERLEIDAPILVVAGGIIFWENRASQLRDHNAFGWISVLRREGPVSVPVRECPELLENIYGMPNSPPIELPEEVRLTPEYEAPGKELIVKTKKHVSLAKPLLVAELKFRYGDILITALSRTKSVINYKQEKVYDRDLNAEESALQELVDAGFLPLAQHLQHLQRSDYLQTTPANLTKAVPNLLKNGWRIEVDRKRYRQAGAFNIKISSNIDWFELHGTMRFDALTVGVPQLLAAVEKGESQIVLEDGSFGIIPEEWLKKYSTLFGLGRRKAEHIRFKKNQAGLLDALIISRPEVDVDKAFAKIREELVKFDRLKPRDPDGVFNGTLRDYQKDGLGWLLFLRDFGLGGCLADDMGLGKTVQVLALLETQRNETGCENNRKPSIIIVPRSLLFNWQEESRKFTPELSILMYRGLDRENLRSKFVKHDVIITTYGTLRRDILELADIEFDYAVLDEAQAIKNSKSQAAKATRLLKADHRLALSGTPIENHIGELWSLFEFLNPGMLGKVSAFNRISSGESRAVLKRAIRPFILRRTKSQVATDLPEKTEQVLYCEMEGKQESMYNELRQYYQVNLAGNVRSNGIGKAKIKILEALLRLRQAACHPGLVNKEYLNEPSAKLESLWALLTEVIDEGHKSLVFSQFTSFLSIFRKKLDGSDIPYLYLDGKTKNRQEKVDAFQNDDKYKVFVISLKAGGLGLNLTAADYVFILDPWWNPAVESQAIDRTHRIGQTRNVFAYRLVSKGTVEERIGDLQRKKMKLVASIIEQDSSIIKDLSADDLTYLLS